MRILKLITSKRLTNHRTGSLFLLMRIGIPKKVKLVFLAICIVILALDANAAKPIITMFNPDNGTASERIRIFGQNFDGIMGITFNGVLATSFSVTAQNQLEVTIPPTATSGPISIQNSSGIGISSEDFIVYNPGPRPFSFDPVKGQVSDVITITGDKFTNFTQVYFHNNIQATHVQVLTQGEIKVVVPPGAVSGPIRLADSSGSNTTMDDFNVVVNNDLEFTITTPAQELAVGETSFVNWKIQSLSNVESIGVELTLLLPDSGIIFERVNSDVGERSNLGRFYQLSNVNIPAGDSWTGSIQFIPTDPSIPFSFEGSIASLDEDPNSENNSMVVGYTSGIRQAEIEISIVQDSKVRLEWPAYPDDWQLFKKSSFQPFSFWEAVNTSPSLSNNRKFIIINPSDAQGEFEVFRLRR